ncbi:hypothetical protein [Leptolyngbya sp. FACHB-711]|uniref:hypothetical protein n=1 Tax=Leptolyngbya sp. FACHB-711 TaxID=2692813 RepID=UPI0016884F7D|nr:hypothetical protein [Leptolyngbya sp. FACHB-711]MBD2024198.1 hypothetical protein [Leptolyngbya sp. FACHB-711]
MTAINLTPYADPDYGILLPTALVLPALGLTDHGLRKFRPLLVENVDFLRQSGPGSIERIFYSATGLLKLANAAATPQAEAFKTALQPYLPPPQGSSPSPPPPRDPAAGIVPLPPHAVQPYATSPSDLDPYAPAQRRVPASTSITTRSDGHADHTVTPPLITPAYAATQSDNPAVQIAQQLAPHLAPAVAAQVAQQVLPQVQSALARLNDRPKALTEAELLFEQQKITLQQFEAIQQMTLAAQEASVSQATTLMNAVPQPQAFFLQGSGGFDDLIALMRSEGMQMLIGLVAFAFGLVALFGFLFSRSADPVSQPDPTTAAPVTPIAPTPVAPVAPVAPAAPTNPVPYSTPPATPQ